MSSLGPRVPRRQRPRHSPDPGLAQAQPSGMSRLQELEAHLARLEGQAAPQPQQAPAASPMPPTATSTPEQDAAYRASRGQQAPPPVSQTAPPPQTPPGASQAPQTPDTSWTPGMRFQALPSISSLSQRTGRRRRRTLSGSRRPCRRSFYALRSLPRGRCLAMERFLALPSIASLPESRARSRPAQEFQAMQTIAARRAVVTDGAARLYGRSRSRVEQAWACRMSRLGHGKPHGALDDDSAAHAGIPG